MARTTRTEARARLTFDFAKTFRERLEELRVDTEADTLTEVVRRSVNTYEELQKIKRSGGTLIVRWADGTETGLILA